MSAEKKVLLVAEGCQGCDQAKQQYRDMIERGELEVRDVTKDAYAQQLAASFDKIEVPMLVSVKSEGTAMKVCRLNPDFTVAECRVVQGGGQGAKEEEKEGSPEQH